MPGASVLNTLQQIAFAFNYSAKRLLAFQGTLQENDVIREQMQRRTNLQTLCDTCWASRADSLYTFRTAYSVVIQALENLTSNGNGKARGYLCSDNLTL